MALVQAQQAVAMLGKADQLSKVANSGAGLSNKIEQFYESVAHVKYGRKDPASRALTVGSQFGLGIMAINVAQFLGAPLALINQDLHDQWIAFNKQSWGLLITTLTNWWSPTLVRVSGDKSVRGQLQKTVDGSLYCDFSERMVLMANHQIYTDWLYLWYIGYTNGMHGRIHVVLKESLKKLPFVGWGMTLSKFIFLKRNWEQDKAGLAKHLRSLNKAEDPMWLMFFPEGTNLAPSTREKSKKWADKNGLKDFQHVLLPRSTGLHFVLLNLRETVEYIYDCTVAYEGVKRGQFAQDIYTIESAWLGGHPPKSVNMHWRRFKISSIPLDDINVFDIWLRARWAEKDALMEHYMQTGRFPADVGMDETPAGEIRQGAGYIETQVKPYNWYEILQVFAPIATFVLVLFYFYNMTIPPSLFSSIQDWAGYSEDEIKKKLRVGPAPKLGKPKAITSSTVAKSLKPPSIHSDQASTISTTSVAKSVPKAPTTKSGVQSFPQQASKPALPTQHPLTSGSASTAPQPKIAPKDQRARTTITSKPPIKAQPNLKPVPKGKPSQPKPSKAQPTQKPKSPAAVPKKPLKKTLYPTTPSSEAPKKALPKTLYPTVYPSTPQNNSPKSKNPPTQKPAPAPTPKTAPTPAPNPKPAPTPKPTSAKAPASKPTPKAPPPTKPPTLAKSLPRRASAQSTTTGWSDTTAVDTTPWAERPSGKRAVKAQETRKERAKMEKKQQRLHLEKVGG